MSLQVSESILCVIIQFSYHIDIKDKSQTIYCSLSISLLLDLSYENTARALQKFVERNDFPSGIIAGLTVIIKSLNNNNKKLYIK
jgi:hypothetical protein